VGNNRQRANRAAAAAALAPIQLQPPAVAPGPPVLGQAVVNPDQLAPMFFHNGNAVDGVPFPYHVLDNIVANPNAPAPPPAAPLIPAPIVGAPVPIGGVPVPVPLPGAVPAAPLPIPAVQPDNFEYQQEVEFDIRREMDQVYQLFQEEILQEDIDLWIYEDRLASNWHEYLRPFWNLQKFAKHKYDIEQADADGPHTTRLFGLVPMYNFTQKHMTIDSHGLYGLLQATPDYCIILY